MNINYNKISNFLQSIELTELSDNRAGYHYHRFSYNTSESSIEYALKFKGDLTAWEEGINKLISALNVVDHLPTNNVVNRLVDDCQDDIPR